MVTGHQAFLTQEALESIARQSIDLLTGWEQKGDAHAGDQPSR
jgi:lactate dehydrogenase-like 2-hydroxyacid dehydrogenase